MLLCTYCNAKPAATQPISVSHQVRRRKLTLTFKLKGKPADSSSLAGPRFKARCTCLVMDERRRASEGVRGISKLQSSSSSALGHHVCMEGWAVCTFFFFFQSCLYLTQYIQAPYAARSRRFPGCFFVPSTYKMVCAPLDSLTEATHADFRTSSRARNFASITPFASHI